ncbi:MAG: hypothetical protein IJP29_08220 [Lachnospiraceae bacterium]|nr:hypothetical protein [Lachnospiraceae bacterium]
MGLLKKYVTMFREDMKEVMARRCGLDELNNFIMLIGFVYVVFALFTGNKLCIICGAVCIILGYMRVFSKNLEKRRKENAVYMRYMGGVVRVVKYCKVCIKMWIKTLKDKEYYYFVCSACHQIIRVPKGKNKVSIRCPKCEKTFIKRT